MFAACSNVTLVRAGNEGRRTALVHIVCMGTAYRICMEASKSGGGRVREPAITTQAMSMLLDSNYTTPKSASDENSCRQQPERFLDPETAQRGFIGGVQTVLGISGAGASSGGAFLRRTGSGAELVWNHSDTGSAQLRDSRYSNPTHASWPAEWE